MTIVDRPDMWTTFDALQKRLGRDFPAILATRKRAHHVHQELTGIVDKMDLGSDLDLVVFGSIARGECTEASDVDWTLMVDGQADPTHRATAHAISAEIRKLGMSEPGVTGVFGNLAFSHSVVHFIGGESDSNKLTTQRILLLLESAAVTTKADSVRAYDRVVKAVIDRYLRDDSIFHKSDLRRPLVPRFLLNDIVRFWRTMCVDFAYKSWEQGGKKWALRNIKLRMSRKLIFIAGLLIASGCYQRLGAAGLDEVDRLDLQKFIYEQTQLPPLEILSRALNNQDEANSVEVLQAYDDFLAMLDDPEKRSKLAELHSENAYGNNLFEEGRDISHRFQKGIAALFFDAEPYSAFIRTYGVF
jgi:predicted nucleotidyltransferase